MNNTTKIINMGEMFNTTTIPTQMNEFTWTDMFTSFSMWFICSIGIFEIIMHYVCKNNKVENDDDEIEKEEKYTDKYVDEFKSLSRRELTKEEMSLLKTKIVRETMPDENIVIMTYDNDLECFCYYTDRLKDVNYNMLETIARKFAIENDCKYICVENEMDDKSADKDADKSANDADKDKSANDADKDKSANDADKDKSANDADKDKSANDADKDKSDANADAAAEAVPAAAAAEPKSVFARFKKYNTGGKGATSNFNPPVKIIEQSNHFRFKGKLCDYKEEEEKKNKSKNEPIMDYANYKNILEKKEN